MSWQRHNLAEDEYVRPAEPPITAGLLYRGGRHMLIGPPEAGKTLVALILGLEHMREGHGSFGILDFEMGTGATRLLLDELGASPEEIGRVYYVAPDAPPAPDDLDAVCTAGVSLVVIDAAAGAFDTSDLDDNSRRDVERFAQLWVAPLWGRGIATIIVDHVVKHREGRGRGPIGSERKLGAVDVALALEAVTPLQRGSDALIRITVVKDRSGHLNRPRATELRLASDRDTHALSWAFTTPTAGTSPRDAANHARHERLMQQVSDFLEGRAEPVSRAEIERHIEGRGADVRTAIDSLLNAGYAVEQPGARGARDVTSRRRYTTSSQLVPPRPSSSRDEVAPPRPSYPPLTGDEDEVDQRQRHEVNP